MGPGPLRFRMLGNVTATREDVPARSRWSPPTGCARAAVARPRAGRPRGPARRLACGATTLRPTARGRSQAHISHLRRGLEPAGGRRARGTTLVSERRGYALRLPPGAVDAWEFEALVQEAAASTVTRRGHPHPGACARAVGRSAAGGVCRSGLGAGAGRAAHGTARVGQGAVAGGPSRARGERAAGARVGGVGRRRTAAGGALAAARPRALSRPASGGCAGCPSPGPDDPRRRARRGTGARPAPAGGAGARPVTRPGGPAPRLWDPPRRSRRRARRRRRTWSTAAASCPPCRKPSTTWPRGSPGCWWSRGRRGSERAGCSPNCAPRRGRGV